MKASIVFDKMPSLMVDGQHVGNIQQIDLDLDETRERSITIDKIHVSDRMRSHIPGGLPGIKPMLAPWEEGRPQIPKHPRVHKIPCPLNPSEE